MLLNTRIKKSSPAAPELQNIPRISLRINKINGVQTNNNEYAILLIQKLDETKKFSKKLEQKTDYYSYWSAGYFEEIVKTRDSL